MKKVEQLKIIKNITGLSLKDENFDCGYYTKNSIIEFKKGKEKYVCIYNGFSFICIPRKKLLLNDKEIQNLKEKLQKSKKYKNDFTFTIDIIKCFTKNKTKGLNVEIDIDELKEIINSDNVKKIYYADYVLNRKGKSENKKMLLNAQTLFDLICLSNAKNFTASNFLLSLDGYCHLFFYSEDKKIFGVVVAMREKQSKKR